MPHVVTGSCHDCRYTDCVVVCPVEAFYGDANMVYIHPHDCDDCEACVPECPVEAIYSDFNVPDRWVSYIQLNLERAEALVREASAPVPPALVRELGLPRPEAAAKMAKGLLEALNLS